MAAKSESGSKHHAYSRKQKSLDLLCSNFVSFYNKDDVDTVCLDDATMKLGVERRGSSCSFDLRLAAMAAGTLPPLMSIAEVIYRTQYSLIEYPSCSAEQLVTTSSILSRSDYQF